MDQKIHLFHLNLKMLQLQKKSIKKISTLKRNTTKNKPNRMIDPTISVPPDIREMHQNITLAIVIIRSNH